MELEQAFEALLPLDRDGRGRLLTQIAAANPGQARALVEMLAAADEAPASEAPATGVDHARGPWSTTNQVSSRDDPSIGGYIGPYRIVRELGRGGMGRVFLARREDEGMAYEVALKLVTPESAGGPYERHLRQERAILCRLSHPNIARMLDGGRAVDGRLYFVMEYVEGQGLDRHCRTAGLNLEHRLGLFSAVCDAVHYAHSQRVIHRDIKPANILVTAGGVVKLLDFGVAKLVAGPEPAPSTVGLGRDEQVGPHTSPFLTREYASPEQLLGAPSDARSDIYALGVVLFELVHGRRPNADELQEGPTPAVVVSAPRRLRRDLGRVIARATATEPGRRYPRVCELQADIVDALAGRALSVPAPGLVERVVAWGARHRRILGLGALSALVLATTLWSVRAARQHGEVRSRELRALSQQVVSELNELFRELPASTARRRRLLETSTGILAELAREHAGDEALALDVARAYDALGDTLGNPFRRNIGQPEAALDSYRRAFAIRRRLFDSRAPGSASWAAAAAELAKSLQNIGSMHGSAGHRSLAAAAFAGSLGLVRSMSVEQRRSLRVSLSRYYVRAAHWHEAAGQVEAAEQALAKAEPMLRAHLQKESDRGLRWVQLRFLLEIRARLAARRGDDSAAIALQSEALTIDHQLMRGDPRSTRWLALGYSNLAAHLARARAWEPALAAYAEAMPLWRSLAGQDRHDRRNLSDMAAVGLGYADAIVAAHRELGGRAPSLIKAWELEIELTPLSERWPAFPGATLVLRPRRSKDGPRCLLPASTAQASVAFVWN